MKRLILVPLIMILASGLILTGCGEEEEAQSGGVLRFIYTEAPQGSIGVPWKMLGLAGGMAGCCLEPLLKSNRQGDVIPCLATDYEWSNDYKTITFTLRKGVKFQDGSDFNAEVCKWNWDMQKAGGQGGTQYVASTEVVDDYTFRVNLTEFQSTWFTSLYRMETGLGWIISKEAYEKQGEEYINWHPVGSGPFKFKDYERDNYLEYEKWDGYWGEKPYLDGLKYLFIADPVTAQMSFEAGEGDAIWTIGAMHKLMHDLVPMGYKAQTYPGLTFCLIPSSGNPDSTLANQKVREAVEYAIDKAKICESIGYDYWVPLYQCAFPYHSCYIKDFEGRRYDPDKAKALLAEAGFPDGFKTIFYAGVHLSGDHVLAIQANLQAAGIDADIDPISVGKWIELETNGWEEGLMLTPQGGQSPFATYMMRFWYRPEEPNWSQGLYWTALDRPDELQNLILEYLKLPTFEEQTAKGREIVQLLHDQCIAIPLWQQSDAVIMQPYVQDAKWGDDLNPTPWNFTGIWLGEPEE